MCKPGTYRSIVTTDGKSISIDSCLVPLVDALNKGGIKTASCCCGHGEMRGHIVLEDMSVLIIVPSLNTGEMDKDTTLLLCEKKEEDKNESVE